MLLMNTTHQHIWSPPCRRPSQPSPVTMCSPTSTHSPNSLHSPISVRGSTSQGGGLYTIFELTAAWHGSITHAMLRLLPALAHRNSFVKNLARQGGLIPLLLVVTKGCVNSHPQTAVGAYRRSN